MFRLVFSLFFFLRNVADLSVSMNESFTGLDNDINDYLVYSTNAFLDAHGRGLEEPDDMQQVLDALLELHDLEPSVESQVYESNYLTIVNAIHLNEVFQSVVNKQIEAIDQLLETNQQLMVSLLPLVSRGTKY